MRPGPLGSSFAQTCGWLVASAFALGCDPPPVDPPPPPPPPWTVAPPAAPSPIVLVCPDGWSSAVRGDGTTVCEPWAGERPTCGEDELLIPGVGCEPISPCTAPVPDAGRALVSAGAPAGGDGSAERPYATIYDAWRAGARDVMLSDGSHAFSRSVSGMTIEGRCPAMTELVLSGELVLTDVTIRGARITGPPLTHVVVFGGSSLTLEEVRMTGLDRALEIAGSVIARRVSVRGGGNGFLAFDAAAIELEQVFFEGLTGLALYAERTAGQPGMALTMRDVVVIGGGDDPGSGQIQADVGALIAERVVIEDCVGIGLNGRGETASVRDLVARRITGPGLSLLGATAEVIGLRTEETAGGVFVAEGAVVTGHGWVLDDSTAPSVAAFEGTLDVRDVHIEDAMGAGIDLEASRATLGNVVISGVAPLAAGTSVGGGIRAERSELVLSIASIRETHTFGLGAFGGDVRASDVLVEHVREGQAAYGVLAVDGATLHLARAELRDTSTVAFVLEEASGLVEDLLVDGVRPLDEVDGIGILVTGTLAPATLELDRGVIQNTVRWGVLSHGMAAAMLSNVEVTSVARAPCAVDRCPETSGGAALVAHDGAGLVVTDFRAADVAYAGVVATSGVHVVLTRGLIEDNGVGMVVSPSLAVNLGLDPGIELVDVVLLDNAVEQQTTEISVEPPRIEGLE